jgi:hypothetical protein
VSARSRSAALALLLSVGLSDFPVERLAAGAGLPVDRRYDPALVVRPDQELVIEGWNRGTGLAPLVIRVEDDKSFDYRSRMNEERRVPPGPFRIRTTAGQWRTAGGRALALDHIRRLIVFDPAGDTPVEVTSAAILNGPGLPENARGWKFGPLDARAFGFEPVGPTDPRIDGPKAVAVTRSGDDPLLTTGLRGVYGFHAALPNGRWTVSLWLDDLGEWEYFPHARERRVRVNGKTAYEAHLGTASWLRDVYLAGRDPEAIADGDPWAVFGARRGGLVTTEIEVSDGQLSVELAGEGADATYLAAILVEPAGQRAALNAILAARQERFTERWPVNPAPYPEIAASPGIRSENGLTPRPVAAGEIASLDVWVRVPWEDRHPSVQLAAPIRQGKSIPSSLRWGQWRYYRRDPQTPALDARADHLRGDIDRMTLRPDLPRRLTVTMTIPEQTPPGRYDGSLSVTSQGVEMAAPISLDVLPVILPKPDRPVGVYLDEPPYNDWFWLPDAERDRAMACDLKTLASLGLTGLAPSLVTPEPAAIPRFAAQLRMAQAAGFSTPLFAYAPVKRLVGEIGLAEAAPALGRLSAFLSAEKIARPIWAIADEPGVDADSIEAIRKLAGALRNAMPDAVLAGQLNNPDHRKLRDLFDVALINDGFEIAARDIAAWHGKGQKTWLYNLPDMELAAGAFLWRSGADGYLQWHARMPTADPFDPTDGREADVMLLPPSPDSCAATPDIDADLLRLSRGIQDLRWLIWLNHQSAKHPEALALRKRLVKAIPTVWRRSATPVFDLGRMRAQLEQLARQLRTVQP